MYEFVHVIVCMMLYVLYVIVCYLYVYMYNVRVQHGVQHGVQHIYINKVREKRHRNHVVLLGVILSAFQYDTLQKRHH